MAAGPSDQQLVRIVQHLAKLHLEVERGVRDPDQLAALMKPGVQLVWHRTRPRGHTLPGGAATDADLGPVSLRRTSDDQVLASITTATQTGRRGALTFVLHIDQRQITIRQARRLHPGRDYGTTTAVGDDPIPDRLVAALEERRAILAALAGERLTTRGATSRRTSGAPHWRQMLGQLDTEIGTLMRTDLLRHFEGHEPSRYRTAGSRKSH